MNNLSTRKQIVLDFLFLSARGDSRKAFNSYVAPGFKHHNAFFKGDSASLMLAMEEDARARPGKIFETLRVLEDGDLVAAHSRFRLNPDDPGYAIMHIFRFEGDRIAELWDFGQAVPPDIVNENGMF
jgi:predicted SnoaL-like aldol condensation-catalyzing enzyme